MAKNVFSGHALGMPWSNFGAKIFRNFFFAELRELKHGESKNAKKKFENFFPIVAHLGHPGLTLRKFLAKKNFEKKNFFFNISKWCNSQI